MSAITKVPLQRLVTISIDQNGHVTHAWQSTTFSIQEDGAEISRQQGAQENIEPADIGSVLPQADLLKQIETLKGEMQAADSAARQAAEESASKFAEEIADRDTANANMTSAHAAEVSSLRTALDDMTARNEAAKAALTPA